MITDRPWGTFEVLREQNNYKVKVLTVNPNEKLSLQYHRHRSEHWVVVEGTALVQIGDEEFTLNVNESTYVPIKQKHRLSKSLGRREGSIMVLPRRGVLSRPGLPCRAGAQLAHALSGWLRSRRGGAGLGQERGEENT